MSGVLRVARLLSQCAIGLALCACVTSVIENVPLQVLAVDLTPVVVPFEGAQDGEVGPVDHYYASVVAQMQEALTDRDLSQLRSLPGPARPRRDGRGSTVPSSEERTAARETHPSGASEPAVAYRRYWYS